MEEENPMGFDNQDTNEIDFGEGWNEEDEDELEFEIDERDDFSFMNTGEFFTQEIPINAQESSDFAPMHTRSKGHASNYLSITSVKKNSMVEIFQNGEWKSAVVASYSSTKNHFWVEFIRTSQSNSREANQMCVPFDAKNWRMKEKETTSPSSQSIDITQECANNNNNVSFNNTPLEWMNKKILVFWEDADGSRWEKGTILSRHSKHKWIIRYEFLEKIGEEDPDVEEVLLGNGKVNWNFDD